jgi:hypothetical protein
MLNMQHTNRKLTNEQIRQKQAAWGDASQVISKSIRTTLKGLEREVSTRAYRASNELRNASLYVLRGQRNGIRYRIPHTKQTYKASAPGEAPAVRTGIFRLSWGPQVRVERRGNKFYCVSSIESNFRVGKYLLGELLEHGTRHMKPRPYKQAVRDRAAPNIKALYQKPYNI